MKIKIFVFFDCKSKRFLSCKQCQVFKIGTSQKVIRNIQQMILSVIICRYSLNLYKTKLILLVCISLFHKCKIILSNVSKTTFCINSHSLSKCFDDFLMEKISSTVDVEV